MQINRSKITQNLLNTLTFVKSKLQTRQVPKASPQTPQTPQYGQVPLPLAQLDDNKKLILMFLVVSIITALILLKVIAGIKLSQVSTTRSQPAITITLPNNKTANRIFWLLVSAAVIAAITEKDWRK
jgi:hypothetical protein